MSINTASPQETYDHMIGSGALSYTWWRDCTTTGETDGAVTDDWTATLTAEDGATGEDKVVTIDHKTVLAAARKAMADSREDVCRATLRECSHLIFDNDATDFDAGTADELLQLIVFGEIVYC